MHLLRPCRMTTSSGKPMDIYENPSEHYGAPRFGQPSPSSAPPSTADRSVQSTLDKHIRTMQVAGRHAEF